MDLCGPMRTESINGKKYVLVIVDDFTRFGWIAPSRTDTWNGVVKKTLDGGFESVGISHENSVPRSPQQTALVSTAVYLLAMHPPRRRTESTTKEHARFKKPFMLPSMNLPKDDVCSYIPGSHLKNTSVPTVQNSELTALQSGRSLSALVKDPNHLVPSYKRTVDYFCFKEGAPAVTESLLPHQVPLPDTSDSDVETLFDHVDSNVFDTYDAPETDSEASHSNSVNIDVTPQQPITSVQKWIKQHPLKTLRGLKNDLPSTRNS
ncbi:retrovirus-related pol polyprotein from transposon TNT 1-94 [Tanacetum coccineum]